MFKNKRKIIFEARKKEDPTIPYRQRIQEIEQNYKAISSEQKHYTNLQITLKELMKKIRIISCVKMLEYQDLLHRIFVVLFLWNN